MPLQRHQPHVAEFRRKLSSKQTREIQPVLDLYKTLASVLSLALSHRQRVTRRRPGRVDSLSRALRFALTVTLTVTAVLTGSSGEGDGESSSALDVDRDDEDGEDRVPPGSCCRLCIGWSGGRSTGKRNSSGEKKCEWSRYSRSKGGNQFTSLMDLAWQQQELIKNLTEILKDAVHQDQLARDAEQERDEQARKDRQAEQQAKAADRAAWMVVAEEKNHIAQERLKLDRISRMQEIITQMAQCRANNDADGLKGFQSLLDELKTGL